jgi:hypothetical protein
MRQHAELSPERWSCFTVDQQVLMIANEMNRGSQLMGAADRDRLRNTYERVLRLTDLTIRTRSEHAFRREMLRWRDLVAQLYIDRDADPGAHRRAFYCLLTFTPVAARQRAPLGLTSP